MIIEVECTQAHAEQTEVLLFSPGYFLDVVTLRYGIFLSRMISS